MKSKNLNPIFSLRLAAEHLKMLDNLASSIGVSRTDVIRMAIISLHDSKKDIAKKRKTI